MLKQIQEALLLGKKDEVEKLVDQALASGLSAASILNQGLIVGMERLGVMFKNNEVFIPEVLVAARAMNAGMAKLELLLIKEGVQPKGSVVIGTLCHAPPSGRHQSVIAARPSGSAASTLTVTGAKGAGTGGS